MDTIKIVIFHEQRTITYEGNVQYYTIIDFNEVDMRIYLPARPRRISLLRVDKSFCLLKLKSITVLLYDFSTKNEIFLHSLLLLKSCSTFNLRTFSEVLLSTVIEIF